VQEVVGSPLEPVALVGEVGEDGHDHDARGDEVEGGVGRGRLEADGNQGTEHQTQPEQHHQSGLQEPAEHGRLDELDGKTSAKIPLMIQARRCGRRRRTPRKIGIAATRTRFSAATRV
jgi:hypothetical protein